MVQKRARGPAQANERPDVCQGVWEIDPPLSFKGAPRYTCMPCLAPWREVLEARGEGDMGRRAERRECQRNGVWVDLYLLFSAEPANSHLLSPFVVTFKWKVPHWCGAFLGSSTGRSWKRSGQQVPGPGWGGVGPMPFLWIPPPRTVLITWMQVLVR